jgi:hypothetical protein
MSKTEALAAQHEAAGYVRSFTFSDGQTVSKCCAPGCHFGTGHGDSNLYTGRHTDSPVEVEPIDHEEDVDGAEKLALDAQPDPDTDDVVEVENEDGTHEFVTAGELDEAASEDNSTLEESAGEREAA